jgi:hypothetical protein
MAKYLFPALFVLFLALNLVIYALITFDLDGSTVSTKQSITGQEMRVR